MWVLNDQETKEFVHDTCKFETSSIGNQISDKETKQSLLTNGNCIILKPIKYYTI